jgi:RNA polymerase sigma-70 factor (ECF subfamily)
MDERDEVERARAGDGDAFAALVRRHAERVHDLARRLLRDAHEAEDVAQQAFLNAWRAMGRFDPERPFRHWILRITTNLCRHRFAARRRRPPGPRGGEALAPDPPAPPPRAPPPDAPRVRTALEALPERYRLAMVLRYVHECSLEEIAEVTGVPVPTVKTHLHRGRSRLREILEGGETGGGAGGTTAR